ncbi:uncharacterized protein DS421_5g135740 [Arachis hypogaea]|nr:uncharacterized protein DS421_5g135740 [Arachis hypogaea]
MSETRRLIGAVEFVISPYPRFRLEIGVNNPLPFIVLLRESEVLVTCLQETSGGNCCYSSSTHGLRLFDTTEHCSAL